MRTATEPVPPSPTALHGAISRITPTSVSAWSWCPRRYYIKYVLGLPESDAGASTDFGKRAHEMLRYIHEHSSCHDAGAVHDALIAHDCDDEVMRSLLNQHVQRCPREVDEGHHEVTRARYHHLPAPYFLATAKVDAIWVHDGLFDIRDYKTGGTTRLELRDDEQARVQAWVWAPLAAKKRLRLRVRYEYLTPEVDEPDAWDPEDDDLAEIEEKLRATVTAMRSGTIEAVADEVHCRACPYRSICSDSAAPGEPVWPVLGASIGETTT
jgi:hypothetical protein